tara:strand:+ start:1743 stop:1970 length:228 start_codon:yes stop_codon:yes gene_type:complete
MQMSLDTTSRKGFDAVCNETSKALPEGYQVEISIEHGGYGVTLIKPDGTRIIPDNSGILECIEDCVDEANGVTEE